MPEAWRIVRAKYLSGAMSGDGGARSGGRWNSRGVPVVYASATRSLAALETLVHLNPPLPFHYKVIRLEFPGDLVMQVAAPLPADWKTEPPPDSAKKLGDAWVRSGESAVLSVPSVIIPGETNFVINPAHPDFRKIAAGKAEDFAFDPRLLKD